MTRSRALLAVGVALAALLARGPLHLVTYGQPASNDDAVPLLMARHVLQGELSTILWNQPYNGTLDTYLLAPGLLVGPAHGVFRAYEALCAIVLLLVVGRLAWRVGGEVAGWTAALLAAVGTPYLALMAATGPTPNFLVPLLTAVPLLVAWRGAQSPLAASAAGLVSGLAVWDSALALPALIGIGAGLLISGRRPTPRSSIAFAASFALGASPLAIARAIGASASSPVTAIRPRWLWLDGLSDLAHAAAGLFGVQVPLVVDGPQRAALPLAASIALTAALLATVLVGACRRTAWPLVGWAAALGAAFASSRRTGADEVRYLYGLALPVLALAGCGIARVASRSRALAVVLAFGLAGPWIVGHLAVRNAWRDPAHADRVWEVPQLDPVLDTLRRANVESAYASLQFAGRLALESEERVLVSQAWNERIPGDPLRFRDEVDLDPQAAWVLSSRLSRGMPRAGGFRDLMQRLAGRWREDAPADFVVFRQFAPPFDESRPVPAKAFTVATLDGTALPPVILDRDPATVWMSPLGITRGSGLEWRLASPRRLSAVAFTVDLGETPLGVPWVCEVDGAVIGRGPARHVLQWVNGAPRAGKQALMTVPLGDRTASSVRLVFQGAGPALRVGEAFLYGPDEDVRPRAGIEREARGLVAARAGDW
ncbi:MAG TPA: hypothetical protein VFQ51_05215, partial [Vicinamibacteria bacterium]|nr:hypothetical protein [Vicinamibacteria bacterium]